MRSSILVCVISSILLLGSSAAAPPRAFDSALVPQDKELRIQRITPEGDDAPAERQIVIQFDRPVVPIGDMAASSKELGITIEPTINCEWRWLNTSALACQLTEKNRFKLAHHYTLKIKAGITAEDGSVLNTAYEHVFNTQRPVVDYYNFQTWLSPSLPVIQVVFNQAVTRESVIENFVFDADGRSVPVDIIDDAENLRANADQPWISGTFTDIWVAVKKHATQSTGNKTTSTIWWIAPSKELPLDSTTALWIKPGLISSEGPVKGKESRAIVSFNTFPAFKFLGVRCTVKAAAAKNTEKSDEKNYTQKLIAPTDIKNSKDATPEQMQCNPLSSVGLVFTAPVLSSAVKKSMKLTPDLAGGRKDYDPWENSEDYSRLDSPHEKGAEYIVWIPEYLKAFRLYTLLIDKKIVDEFGRSLTNNVDMKFATAHRSPDLRMPNNIAVLEKNVNSELPLYVTNLDYIDVSYHVVFPEGDGHSTARLTLPKVKDVAFATPLNVRPLLAGKSALLYGHLQTVPAINSYENQHRFFTQISPFMVHVKLGHFSSLAWVTRFDNGKPVANATLKIYQTAYTELNLKGKALAEAKTDAQGRAWLPGIVNLDPSLSIVDRSYDDKHARFMLRVDDGRDMAVLPLDNQFDVPVSDIWPSLQKQHGHMKAWGTTAQGIYKPGDTIQFKIYVRNQSNTRWVAPPKQGYKIQIMDPQGQSVYEKENVSLNEFGSFADQLVLEKAATTGQYEFSIKASSSDDTLSAMSVLVTDFVPAAFKVSADLNGKQFKPNDKLDMRVSAALHAGGPYTNAKTRLTVQLKTMDIPVNDPKLKSFEFGSDAYGNSQTIHQQELVSNNMGELNDVLKLDDYNIIYGRLEVEAAVSDDRGKSIATLVSAEYAGRDRFVGLHNTQWVYEQDKPARVEYAVIGLDGKLKSSTPVTIAIEYQETKATRVKGAGNAYLTRYITEWVNVANCKASSQLVISNCHFTPKNPGYYKITANIQDTQKRKHSATTHTWVSGKGNVVWEQSDDARLSMIAEQEDYKIGQTARFLVKNPFPGATALITVERYGVMRQWIKVLDSSTPIIEVPLKPDDFPGVYVSVLVTSPRVEQPLSPTGVDLGKPTYRIGYARVIVKDDSRALTVKAKTTASTYKPGQIVKASITVNPKDASVLKEPIELAVVVLDEAVLDLNTKKRDYYDPYAGFNQLDSLDLKNFNTLTRLVGLQKFEKKGANPGGDGLSSSNEHFRNLIKYVAYWNPSIKTVNGKVNIEFKVPDNLTGWRIFVLAVTPNERMGLGETRFTVNQPIEIRPVMPNQALEGDQFKAGFTVMNRTDKAKTVTVRAAVSGAALDPQSQTTFEQSITLLPYKRESVWLNVKTKQAGQLVFRANANDAVDSDALEYKLPINKRRSLITAANYGTTTQDHVTEVIQFPQNIYSDVGGISVVVSPSVIGNVAGAFDYVRDYPYACWEQRLTKAVMASHYNGMRQYLPDSLMWADAKTLAQTTLDNAASFQAPNGGMTYWVANNEYVDPYLSAYTALAFNWLRAAGEDIPADVEKRLQDYLKTFLREDSAPSFYSKGMASTVRAVALAALADQGVVDASDIKRYAPYATQMDLFGKAHLLMAANRIDGSSTEVTTVLNNILASASQSGGKFQFNETLTDGYSQLLTTPLRSNCAVLSALLVTAVTDKGFAKVGDIPFKMVRAITQSRGNRDHWENTQENMFCMNSLLEFARVYEKDPVNFTATAMIEKRLVGKTSFSDLRQPAVTLKDAQAEIKSGLKTNLTVNREGTGRMYYATRLQYANTEVSSKAINAGIEVHREYSIERKNGWEILATPMLLQRGDVVRVDIYVSVPTVRHFVVIDDPVPGGLEPVNRDLATSSTIDTDKGAFKPASGSWYFKFGDWQDYGISYWNFYHRELRHDAVRFYSDYLPAGNYHVSYSAQVIAEGEFSVMPVNVEEMYDPDVFGKGTPATLKVRDAATVVDKKMAP
ncbi:MAG: large extracellular alpha-helical protein [Gammaproteobacteria bacterium]|nr:large extracellular alpha-helical protein [Gammaproteobacteria bacterium]